MAPSILDELVRPLDQEIEKIGLVSYAKLSSPPSSDEESDVPKTERMPSTVRTNGYANGVRTPETMESLDEGDDPVVIVGMGELLP